MSHQQQPSRHSDPRAYYAGGAAPALPHPQQQPPAAPGMIQAHVRLYEPRPTQYSDDDDEDYRDEYEHLVEDGADAARGAGGYNPLDGRGGHDTGDVDFSHDGADGGDGDGAADVNAGYGDDGDDYYDEVDHQQPQSHYSLDVEEHDGSQQGPQQLQSVRYDEYGRPHLVHRTQQQSEALPASYFSRAPRQSADLEPPAAGQHHTTAHHAGSRATAPSRFSSERAASYRGGGRSGSASLMVDREHVHAPSSSAPAAANAGSSPLTPGTSGRHSGGRDGAAAHAVPSITAAPPAVADYYGRGVSTPLAPSTQHQAPGITSAVTTAVAKDFAQPPPPRSGTAIYRGGSSVLSSGRTESLGTAGGAGAGVHGAAPSATHTVNRAEPLANRRPADPQPQRLPTLAELSTPGSSAATVALPAGAAARRFLDTYTTHAAAPVTAVGVGGITIGSSVVANPHPTAAANDDAAGSSKKTSGGSNELSQHSQQRQLDDVVFFRECVHSLLGISELQIAQWDAELLAYAPMQTAVQMRKLDGLLAANPGSPQTSELETFTVAPRQAALFNEWVAPCASLRRRLGEYLSRPAASFLQQALRRAVERQLSAYDRFVTSIRCGDAAGPRASGSALASTRRAGDGAASSLGTRAVNSDTELFAVRLEGLAALQVATLKARPKLRALHDVLAALEAAKGGALMSRLQALHRHGGEEIEAMLDDVYRETIAPLLFMTLQWLTKGACTDPFDEFFVSNETAVPEASDKYWTQRHVLRPLMLPASMLSQEQAAKVLAAGKNVNFLQRLCKAREWSLPASILAKARHTTFETIPSLTDECLDASNRAVLATLNDKFRLAEAFERARVVYLLADADFATGVIHRMEDVLSPAVAQRGAARMQAEAQEALVAAITSMGRLLPPCMAGIDTIILAEVADPGAPPGGGGGDASQSQASQQQQQYTGWDTFVMALPFPPPYNVFFSTDTVRQYRRLFRLLWKVRRAEVELKRTWQLYCQVIRGKEEEGLLLAASRRNAAGSRVPSRHPSPESAQADAEFRAGQRELRQASARVFQHLTHFVSNLQMYLVTEVVEAAWLRFRAALARCRAVDDIVRAHAEYLGAMMQYALLREQYGDVKVLVNHVLNLALDFCGRFQRDFVVATSGTTATVAAGVSPQRVTATIRETLRLVDGSVRVLLDRIERDPVTLDFMQALAARLNFNHFYSEPVM